MSRARLIQLLEDVLQVLADKLPSIPRDAFPLQEGTTLESLGISASNVQLLMRLMEDRLGIQVNFRFMLTSQHAITPMSAGQNIYSTVGQMVSHIESSIRHHIKNPKAIFIDPDPANRRAFEKAMGHRLNVQTFGDPLAACRSILKKPEIVVVVTRATMPTLSGEQLRRAVHRYKPFLKFILIEENVRDGTALPVFDKAKFHSVIPGLLDLEARGDDIFDLITSAFSSAYPGSQNGG